MKIISKTFKFGDHEVILETGRFARQASGAVMVRMGDTAVLVTVVGVQSTEQERDFFPLTVVYQERAYAAGRIPGGFLKREGRLSEKEVLTSRLIDRPLRPLFPEGFNKEVQIIASVMSLDPETSSDILSILGASAALAISGIPFLSPIGAARVGYRDGAYLLNPSMTQLDDSDLDLVVAGTEHAVLMVESEAAELSEEIMLGAVKFGHDQMQVAIQAIKELAQEVGTTGWDWSAPALPVAWVEQVTAKTESAIREAYEIREKPLRRQTLSQIVADAVKALCLEAEGAPDETAVKKIIGQLEEQVVRGNILAGHPRIDGRDTKTIRPITVDTGILPRTHGSAVFTRGETQAIVVATLGTERDSQLLDELTGERKDTFMLHYNFPPYSVGEVGMMGSPKRREIGHGRLARRALEAVLPSMEEFPYVIRVVSEITESNGSSSMATVCGASLSLMDAGVPMTAPVAGIAMGLIKEGDKFAVLSDILGDEDHLGDMDFKVAGTEVGVTALQMDIKIEGITFAIMEQALAQAREGRLHILSIMNSSIGQPRQQVSNFAPRITTIRIKPDKIRDVIGKGGIVIRQLIEETGAMIDISDDGTVKISAVDNAASEEARRRIEAIVSDVEIGAIYEGTVVKIVDFGAFVAVLNNKQGLVHISQIANERIENVRDKLEEGQVVKVKVLEIDRQGKIRLSMKEALSEAL